MSILQGVSLRNQHKELFDIIVDFAGTDYNVHFSYVKDRKDGHLYIGDYSSDKWTLDIELTYDEFTALESRIKAKFSDGLYWMSYQTDDESFEIKDSGERQKFETGSQRDTREGKGRYDLIPPYPLFRLALHYEKGAKKYDERNWEKGQPLMRYIDSAFRHLEKVRAGYKDEDHESAVVWNMFGFTHTLKAIKEGRLPKELDDRPEWMKEGIVIE